MKREGEINITLKKKVNIIERNGIQLQMILTRADP